MKWYILESAEEQIIGQFDHNPFDDWEFKVRGFSTGSSGYDTKEALWEANHILPQPCIICKRWIQLHWIPERNQKLIERNMCFGCTFWDEKLQAMLQGTYEGRRKMVVNGCMYSIAPDDPTDDFKGFGGTKFQFLDLRTNTFIVSRNTWFNGEIPTVWLPAFPDTAIMIEGRTPFRVIT